MISNTVKEKFEHGRFVFTYYRFLDKFHCEPKSWAELMEFPNYMETDSAVNKLIMDNAKQEK